MKYTTLKEDMLAIKELVETGRIDNYEAGELRRYIESIA